MITRRNVLSTMALAAPAYSRIMRALAPMTAEQLVFAGIGVSEENGRIDVFRVNGDRRRLASSIAAASPRTLALHPALPVLYVAHCIAEQKHRPRGAISSYRIDTGAAALSLISHEPLTLAATLPNRIAVAPDGNHLIVASSKAAILNLFPLRSDGALLPGPFPLKLPLGTSSQLHIAFTDARSVIAKTSPDDVERLIIHPGSTLARDLESSGPKFASKRILAAQSAASIAILSLS